MRHHPANLDRTRWRRLRVKMLDNAGWRCRQCGKAGLMELDHVKPVSQGGQWWSEKNLQILCKNCHFLKTGKENRLNSAEIEAWEAIVATETVRMVK